MPAPRQTPLGLHLNRSARVVERAFNDAMTEAGGSGPTWTILLALRSGAARNQRQIAERVGIRGATLTHHLDAMESRGLVVRRRDPDNRRVHIVELTDTGQDLFGRLRGVAGEFDRRLRGQLPDADLDTLRRLLSRLAENVASS